MDNNIDANDVSSSSLLRVLLALKTNIMKALHVAEIYMVSEITPVTTEAGEELYKSYKCVAINNKQRFIYCFAVKDLEINTFDNVVVVFCDEEYATNYKRIKANNSKQDKESKTRHALQYGVIIGVI